jgi:GDP-mannose 6-dehydrogenase
MKACVYGLGYVGSVTAGCLASLGHTVIAIDVNSEKIKMMNAGQSPVFEPGLAKVLAKARNSGKLKAVADASEAVASATVSLICVGTPSREDGGPDLSYVKRVCGEIGRSLSNAKKYHLVVVRSTLLPGSTETVIIPLLEQSSGLVAGRDFGLCYNPEFLREGSAVHDFLHPPFTLIGKFDERGAKILTELYRGIKTSFQIVPIKAAEMVKYASNAFHALKVAYANEIGNVCKKINLDGHRVMEIFCLDKDLNIGSSYLRPGFAFGGACLPKDLRALVRFGNKLGLNLPVLEAILPSNSQQIEIGLEMIRRTGKKKVALLGISFKATTDDMRESPLVELASRLIDEGFQVRIYDKIVALSRLVGANKAYVERKLPNLLAMICASLEDALNSSEVIVIGKEGEDFRPVLKKARKTQVIIDFAGMDEIDDQVEARYQGICW